MKALLLILALAASPAMAQDTPIYGNCDRVDGCPTSGGFIIKILEPQFLTIVGRTSGAFLVQVSLKDGSVVFGPDYTSDETARAFWMAMGRAIPKECK